MLDTPIEKIGRITEAHKIGFKKLGIKTYRDLLYLIPNRYLEASVLRSISNISAGDEVVLHGVIENIKNHTAYGNIPSSVRATLADHSGNIKLIWFSQIYISKMFKVGSLVKITGKVSEKSGVLSIVNPEISNTKNLPIDSSDSLFKKEDFHEEFLTPVYPETKGISSRYISSLVKKVLANAEFSKILDPLPENILKKYSLPGLKDSLLYIHFPKSENHFLAARKRLAFEEIFYLQIERAKDREILEHTPGFLVERNESRTKEFISKFNFELTSSQKEAIEKILDDLQKGVPMSRLIEGDVGSGKTAVAAVIANLVGITRPYIKEKGVRQEFGTLQVAYMAPTEILAKQHFENFVEYFKGSGLALALITGSKCLKYPSKSRPGTWTDISRSQLSKWVENGEIAVVVGTHALIQKNVKFKHLALCIIDEQHRFGVKQRRALVQKKGVAGDDFVPHLISMTATPIPRTLALTIYGDLDLTIIDQMPLGRKKTITEVVRPDGRDVMYESVISEINKGRQIYVICPRIDDPDENKASSLQVRSVDSEAKKLKAGVFKKYNVATLHGKMKATEKDAIMKDFYAGAIDVLVATSVIEVGVSVENATVIIIEGADRFGLSQLHQLRGRVIRGNHQSYCYVCSENASEKTLERLNALVTAKNGFELAELDLLMRGSGGLTQGKQWGVSDVAMEAIKNIKLVEAAREEAKKIVQEDRELLKYPILKHILDKKEKTHFE